MYSCGLVADSCGNGNEPSGSMVGGGNSWSTERLLSSQKKKDSTHRNYSGALRNRHIFRCWWYSGQWNFGHHKISYVFFSLSSFFLLSFYSSSLSSSLSSYSLFCFIIWCVGVAETGTKAGNSYNVQLKRLGLGVCWGIDELLIRTTVYSPSDFLIGRIWLSSLYSSPTGMSIWRWIQHFPSDLPDYGMFPWYRPL